MTVDALSPERHVYESEAVHYGVANPRTQRIGYFETPTVDISTACQENWTVRPRRTLCREDVTCAACWGAMGRVGEEERG